MRLDSFKSLASEILKYEEGTESHLTVLYLKDVSTMLAMVSAVREGDLRRHVEAERHMLGLTFALDHQNYARYISYQHVFLEEQRKGQTAAYQDLTSRGFGGSESG